MTYSQLTLRLVLNVLAMLVLATLDATPLHAEERLQAPIRVLQVPDSPVEDGQATGQAPTQPTLPDGKLPQYQLGHRRRALPTMDQLGDARAVFVLALPERPIVVELSMTIDSQPFLQARERRIERLLSDVNQTDPEVGSELTPHNGSDPEVRNSTAVDDDALENVNVEDDIAAADDDPADAPSESSYVLAAAPSEFFRRYQRATGNPLSADEARWLLTNRIDGPALLLLNDNFQKFRATQRPGFHAIDLDRSGVISAAELVRAVDSLKECDLNRDEVVAATEIAEVASDPRLKKETEDGMTALLIPWTDLEIPGVREELAARYGGTLPKLVADEPHLAVSFGFDTSNPERSVISLDHRSADLGPSPGSVQQAVITVPVAGAAVVFSGVQSTASDQISIGAVNDGYPVLPVLDRNDDGRLTVRELREVVDGIQGFDRNGDGAIAKEELPVTIRVCAALGAVVHEELVGIRSLRSGPVDTVVGPDWFVRMDRNNDNDLTRGEFPGTDEQFRSLDADEDGLVSAKEALVADNK